MPRPFALVVAALIGLVAAGTVAAHVVATPAFLPSGTSASISLATPNERDDPMTGFSITAPAGLGIEHAHEVDGWSESLDGSTATWTGGSLEPEAEATFGVSLKADAEPDIFELSAEQRYDDGAVVSWPVSITVTPADESSTQSFALAAVVAMIGVLLVGAIAMLAWRRRSAPTLQEK